MKFFVFIIVIYFIVVLAEEGKNVPSVHINCTDDDHCGDFRMVCSKNQNCICSRFYDWDENLKQCSLNLPEIGLWLDSMKEEKDLREHLDKEADQIFKQLALAGISAILTGLFGGLACVYCFCIKEYEEDEESTPVITPTEDDKKNIEAGDAGLSNILFINP